MTESAPYRPPAQPEVKQISLDDVSGALRAGIHDFVRAPVFGLFFGGVYVLGGLFILACLMVFGIPWMIIPVAIGFPLIGPFVAVGLYEISRRLERGEQLSWRGILTVVVQQRHRQLGWMAFVVLFIFWIWIYQVRLLVALFFGFRTFTSIPAFLDIALTTAQGLAFLGVGTLVGGFLALVLYSSTVIAMPLLLDRDIDFVTAMITSFRTVFSNPVPMLGFGLIVAALTIVALLPAFAGLLMVLPVLGHATWHLYTRAIASGP
ncbi:MAG: DUF2189 domain-containing protein [Pseudomonadota bacterium]